MNIAINIHIHDNKIHPTILPLIYMHDNNHFVIYGYCHTYSYVWQYIAMYMYIIDNNHYLFHL